MTDDDKKKAIVTADKTEPDTATDLAAKEAQRVLDKFPLKTLLLDAIVELAAAREAGRPLVIDYKVPCPCGKCNTKLSVQITPYTSVLYDVLRSKH